MKLANQRIEKSREYQLILTMLWFFMERTRAENGLKGEDTLICWCLKKNLSCSPKKNYKGKEMGWWKPTTEVKPSTRKNTMITNEVYTLCTGMTMEEKPLNIILAIMEKIAKTEERSTYPPGSFDRLMKYTLLCIGMTVEEKPLNIILAIMEKIAKTEER